MTAANSKSVRQSRKSGKNSLANGGAGLLTVEAVRSGEWLLGDELHHSLVAASKNSQHLSVDLGGIDHLDANSLQLLLALSLEKQREGGTLCLLNPSPSLSQWFAYAGASKLLPIAGMEP